MMAKGCVSVGLIHHCVPLWILLFCHQISAEVLRKNIYFLEAYSDVFTIPAPALKNGTEFSWEWTPHHGRQKSTQLATVTSPFTRFSWTMTFDFWQGGSLGISMYMAFKNAGVYSFKRTKPDLALLAQFEVFVVIVSPFPLVPVGFDVSSRCEISHLQKAAVVQWERRGEPPANTTLLYNNTAYITIHNVNQSSSGRYSCNVRRHSGELLFTTDSVLTVTTYTYNTHSTLYRSSSNSSELEMTCQDSQAFWTATWTREQQPAMARETLAFAERDQSVKIDKKTDRRRFSFSAFNGKRFSLRIAPLKFEDSGIYKCSLSSYIFAWVTLVNIQVSVEPPGGVSRYGPVVLNCAVSEVPETLSLAWLRMEGQRGVLVKQEVLQSGGSLRNLSLSLSGLGGGQLHWQCAVFGERMLRAQVLVHLTLQPGDTLPIILGVCVGAVCVAMLISAGLLYYRRTAAAALATSPGSGNHTHTCVELDDMYYEVTDKPGQEDKATDGEVLYSSVSLAESRRDQKERYPEPDSEGQRDSVVYSVLNIT